MPNTYSKIVCKLQIFFGEPIGRGPNGNVYDGCNENVCHVAVKAVKRTKDNEPMIKQLESTYRFLKKVGGSKETLPYVTMEDDGQTIYIATQRWGFDATKLLPLLKNGKFKDKRKIMKDICKAIDYLHSNGIVHGKIHPGNVRFNENTAKIVDFGVSHIFPGTQRTWMSPEQIRAVVANTPRKATTYDDILNLATLLYYIYTNGKHLFGDDRTSQEENIRNNKPIFTGHINCEFEDLIFGMINKNPKKRLNIKQVIKHPFFWTNQSRLYFIKDLVRHINDMKSMTPQLFKKYTKCIDQRLNLVSIGGWHVQLGREWNDFLKTENKRHWCEDTLFGLLCFIRNKFEHGDWKRDIELSRLLKNDDGQVDEDSFMRFFMGKFPRLILVLATTECVNYLKLKLK